MSSEIKKNYKFSIYITIIAFFIGLVFKIVELYFGFFVGGIISLINVRLLISGINKIMYFKSNAKLRGNFELWKRLLVFCIGMFLVGKISQRYFADHVSTNLLFTGIGATNYKIAIILRNCSKKIKKKLLTSNLNKYIIAKINFKKY